MAMEKIKGSFNMVEYGKFLVTLQFRGRAMEVVFHGHPNFITGKYRCTTAEVMNCVLGDAFTYFNALSFEDWCRELLFDSQKESSRELWEAVAQQADDLEDFLRPGSDEDEEEYEDEDERDFDAFVRMSRDELHAACEGEFQSP